MVMYFRCMHSLSVIYTIMNKTIKLNRIFFLFNNVPFLEDLRVGFHQVI